MTGQIPARIFIQGGIAIVADEIYIDTVKLSAQPVEVVQATSNFRLYKKKSGELILQNAAIYTSEHGVRVLPHIRIYEY